MADSNKTVLWVCGHPCSGKTWMGDYLESRGFKHVDGDYRLLTAKDNEESKKLSDALSKCFFAMQAGTPITQDMWQSYYDDSIERINEALKDHDKVVFTFALFDVFGEKDYVVSHLPQAKFILNDVSHDTLYERHVSRNALFLEKLNTTDKQMWESEHYVEARKLYGDEYTPERMKQYIIKMFFGFSFDKFVHDGERFFRIDNNDFASLHAVKEVNKLAGLEDAEIDVEAIREVNYKRIEKVTL